MRILYFAVLFGLGYCVSLKRPKPQLSAPELVKVTVWEPPMIEVSWNRVDSVDDEDPVIGYKVKIWEVNNIKTSVSSFINGKVIIVEKEEEKEEPINSISGPTGTPTEILTSAKVTSAIYRNVKRCVNYEIRILAYTKNYEGPMSSAFRVKVLDKK